jgi:hypothetical protein
MTTPREPQSIESRARRIASRVHHQQLLQHAEQLQKEGKSSAKVFWRALDIQKENRALESSLTLSHVMGDAVYELRPAGRLPTDGVGLEL